VIADGDDIIVFEMVLYNTFVVDEGSVRAVQILDKGILANGENAGVVAADRHVVEQNFTAGSAADIHVALLEHDLVDDHVVNLRIILAMVLSHDLKSGRLLS